MVLDLMVPKPQWVRTSHRDEGTEAHGRQRREEPHPFSGPPWKERELTPMEAQEVPALNCPWIIPALSTALGQVTVFPGEHQGPGTPRDSPEVTPMEGEALGAS